MVKVPDIYGSYEKIRAGIRAEAERRKADRYCWQLIDLHDGDAVTFVWFGTAAQIAKVTRLLKSLPKTPHCTFLSQHSDVNRVEKALRTAFDEPSKHKARQTKPCKRGRR